MGFDLIRCRGHFTSVSEMHGRGDPGDLSFRIDLCVCQPAAGVLLPFPFTWCLGQSLMGTPFSIWEADYSL